MKDTNRLRLCLLLALVLSDTIFARDGIAINGGAVPANAAAKVPHSTVGATVWQTGPHLVEPCTAVLMCENVILTAAHCLNFNWKGESYFSLDGDLNTVNPPGTPVGADRYTRTQRQYARAGQTTVARVDKDSVEYGAFHRMPAGPLVGLAMAKFKGADTLPGLTYPNLVAQGFVPVQDPAFLTVGNTFINPGNAATLGRVGGYGDNAAARAGAGTFRNGVMRFTTWQDPTNGNYYPLVAGRVNPPLANANAGFLLELSRGQDNNAHGCPGDSGSGLYFGAAATARLGGILELVTDQACRGVNMPHANNPNGIPNASGFVNLVNTGNRRFIRDYMIANCTDNRQIDLKTGDNKVVPPEDDECASDPDKEEPGACGCGIPDTDNDFDGVPDCQDLCLDDGDKVDPGYCGCGMEDNDFTGDGVPDCWLPTPTPTAPIYPTPGPSYCPTPEPSVSPTGVESPLPTATVLPPAQPTPTATTTNALWHG